MATKAKASAKEVATPVAKKKRVLEPKEYNPSKVKKNL